MSFLTVLRSDLKVFLKCINYQLNNGTKLRTSQTCLRPFVRYYSDEIERRLAKPLTDKIVMNLKKFDKIGPQYDLIYRAPRSFAIYLAHASVLTLIFTVPPLVFLIGKKHNFKLPMRINEMLVINDLASVSAILGMITCLLVFMYLLVSRFPLRIYKLKTGNDYIVSYPNVLQPWQMSNVNFKSGEVTRINVADKLFYMTNYEIKGCKSMLFEHNFIRPVELDYMLKSKIKSEE